MTGADHEFTMVARGVIQRTSNSTLTPEQLLSATSASRSTPRAPRSRSRSSTARRRPPRRSSGRSEASSRTSSRSASARETARRAANTPATPPLTATVWDPAHVIPGKVQPNPGQNLIIAGVLGLVLGLLAAFLRDYFDRTLRTTQEIEQALGIPVIGQIPVPQTRDRRPHMLLDGDGPFEEAFYALRTNLQYIAVGHPLRRILVTSSVPDEGKTTVCANLALAFAQSGASVAVLETDLRRPAPEQHLRPLAVREWPDQRPGRPGPPPRRDPARAAIWSVGQNRERP